MRGATLDEAVQALAKKTAPHLEANESARVIVHNLSPLPNEAALQAQAALDRALRKRVRNMTVRDVTLTISRNMRGYLLVTEVGKGAERAIEMESFEPDSAPKAAAPIVIEKRLVWEQSPRILDVAFPENAMVVLDAEGLARYERPNGRWERAENAPLPVPVIRDLRGRLEIAGASLNAYLPGLTCRGGWRPLRAACEPASAPFTLEGAAVRFTPGRNTLEGRAAGDALRACGTRQLAPGDGEMDAEDNVALYEGGTAVSDPVELPGPVTALWPAPGGALAVARNLATGKYAAYALAFDCGR